MESLLSIYGYYVHASEGEKHTMYHFDEKDEAMACKEQTGGEVLDICGAGEIMGALFGEDAPTCFTDDDIADANYQAICAALSDKYGEWNETLVVPPDHSGEQPMWIALGGAYCHPKAGKEIRVWMLGDDECFGSYLHGMYEGFYQYVADDQERKVFKAYFNTDDEDGNDIPLDEVDYAHPWLLQEVEYDSVLY